MAKKSDRTWKVLTAAFIVALFYIGSGLHEMAGGAPLANQAHADVIGGSVTQDHEDVLITSSSDGRKLYLWTFGPWNLSERRVPELKRVVVAPAGT